MLVETKRTIVSEQEMCTALIKAWKKIYEDFPKKESICIIMAQHQLETGGNNFWNYNIGNVKYVKSNGNVPYIALRGVWEIINNVRVELAPTDPGSWFRAFATLDEGVEFQLNFLANGRYRKAWEAVKQGNPRDFVMLLQKAGYFTAPLEDYIKAELYYFNKFMVSDFFSKAMRELNPPPPLPMVDPNINPIVHPKIDLTPSEPQETTSAEAPITLTRLQKVSNFFSGLFKK